MDSDGVMDKMVNNIVPDEGAAPAEGGKRRKPRRRGGRQPASGQGGEESTIPEGDEASEGGTKKLHSKNRYRNRGSKPADGKEVPDGERSGPRPRNARRGNRQRCFNCGKSGHQTRECELPPGNTNCYTCLQPGHKSSECPNGKPAEMAA